MRISCEWQLNRLWNIVSPFNCVSLCIWKKKLYLQTVNLKRSYLWNLFSLFCFSIVYFDLLILPLGLISQLLIQKNTNCQIFNASNSTFSALIDILKTERWKNVDGDLIKSTWDLTNVLITSIWSLDGDRQWKLISFLCSLHRWHHYSLNNYGSLSFSG